MTAAKLLEFENQASLERAVSSGAAKGAGGLAVSYAGQERRSAEEALQFRRRAIHCHVELIDQIGLLWRQ